MFYVMVSLKILREKRMDKTWYDFIELFTSKIKFFKLVKNGFLNWFKMRFYFGQYSNFLVFKLGLICFLKKILSRFKSSYLNRLDTFKKNSKNNITFKSILIRFKVTNLNQPIRFNNVYVNQFITSFFFYNQGLNSFHWTK
jgi:hypothetical protein